MRREPRCKHCRKFWRAAYGTITGFWIDHAVMHGLYVPWDEWDPKKQEESLRIYRRFCEENFDDLYIDDIRFVQCAHCFYIIPMEREKSYCGRCGKYVFSAFSSIKGVAIQEGKVGLRPVESGDLERFKNWRNSWYIRKACREHRLLNGVNQDDWFERMSRDGETVMFSIVNENQELIGCCGLTYIDWLHRRTEISVYIGEVAWQTGGYGTMALKALIKYAFEELDMHKLEAEIFAFNEDSVKLFERVGFKKSGILPEHHFTMGKYWDSLLYYFLSDWYFGGRLPWQKE